jgi:hypothetical protein
MREAGQSAIVRLIPEDPSKVMPLADEKTGHWRNKSVNIPETADRPEPGPVVEANRALLALARRRPGGDFRGANENRD